MGNWFCPRRKSHWVPCSKIVSTPHNAITKAKKWDGRKKWFSRFPTVWLCVRERSAKRKEKARWAEEIITSSTVSHHKSKPTWKICILGPLLRTHWRRAVCQIVRVCVCFLYVAGGWETFLRLDKGKSMGSKWRKAKLAFQMKMCLVVPNRTSDASPGQSSSVRISDAASLSPATPQRSSDCLLDMPTTPVPSSSGLLLPKYSSKSSKVVFLFLNLQ